MGFITLLAIMSKSGRKLEVGIPELIALGIVVSIIFVAYHFIGGN